jgi:hypothetical protein
MNKDHSVQPSMARVAVLPWHDAPGCYLVVSGERRRKEQYGERWYKGHEEHRQKYPTVEVRTTPRITFTYVCNGVAAEWDGENGPIQLWFRSHEGYKEGYDEARAHWLWPFAFGAGHWAQGAVDEAKLPDKFNEGDFDGIFRVLRDWVDSRNGVTK